MSLAARHLEANGVPAVIMGCAKDIVEHCGVPRFVWSDFPLGNSAGRPFDAESQRQTLELALSLLECAPAWDGNGSSERFLAFAWEGAGRRLLVTVNYAPEPGQCYVRPPWSDLAGRDWALTDLVDPTTRYDRAGDELAGKGLYLDLPAWGHHVFEVAPRA